MACNTAHLLLPEIERLTGLKFISLIESTIEHLDKDAVKTVGLLATPTTIKTGIYSKSLEMKGIGVIKPSGQDSELLEEIIRNAISNKTVDVNRIMAIATGMVVKGAERIVIGCTELSLALKDVRTNRIFVDPMDIVIEKVS